MILGNRELPRAIVDSAGVDRIIHPLQSANFLKMGPLNYLCFECASADSK
jgi:hypothetical protein